MSRNKPTAFKKPVLSAEAVLGFAEGRTAARTATSKAKTEKAAPRAAAEAAGASTSRFPPSGDVRLTVNMRGDLHMRLKMEAVKNRTTVGEILEAMVEKHIKG